MAASDQLHSDPLLALRNATTNNSAIVITKSADRADAELSLARATHVFLGDNGAVFAVTTPTRFISSERPVDLRSILQAWAKNKESIQEYVNSVNALNDELAKTESGRGQQITQLTFVEKIALCSWLEGQSDDCEYIKPLVDEAAVKDADAAARVAEGKVGGVELKEGRRGKDERLAEIYRGERKMGDRNTVLRGIKPTVCLSFSFTTQSTTWLTITILGLLPYTQTRRTLPRSLSPKARGSHTRTSAVLQRGACRKQVETHTTPRAHHSSLPLGILTSTHHKYPPLSREWHLRSSRFAFGIWHRFWHNPHQ